MNYYEHHLGDYARDAGHLSMVEDGAYRRLIDIYYIREAPLPLDIKECQKLARCTSAAERKAVEYVLSKFFVVESDGYHQKRCDAEIQSARARIGAARENGKKGGRPRTKSNPPITHKEPNVNPVGFDSETQPFNSANPAKSSPISSLQSEESKSRCAALALKAVPDPPDPRKQLYDLGKTILGQSSGSLISKQIGLSDERTVAAVLGEMAMSTKADPKAYFIAATTPKQRGFVA